MHGPSDFRIPDHRNISDVVGLHSGLQHVIQVIGITDFEVQYAGGPIHIESGLELLRIRLAWVKRLTLDWLSGEVCQTIGQTNKNLERCGTARKRTAHLTPLER